MTNLRKSNIKKLPKNEFDVLILGGGINGAVSAAALAAKGVKVALIDKGDFAGFTSSNSSNLAWGGIKYLESYEYTLVNKLCKSRNHLMRSYPSTVKEIRFLTSIQRGFRFPPFFIYMGTLLYWAMGRFFTKFPNYLSAQKIKELEPIIDTSAVNGGFEYSDCYLYDNDARFVFNFIRSSMSYGCIAANYVESQSAKKEGDIWVTTAKDIINNDKMEIRSKCIINACGPFVDPVNNISGETTEHHHVFSKGIHLIVERITESNKVLTFFADDGRLFFVIPMGTRTCIGTTDSQVESPNVKVTDEDRQFILDNANNLLDLETALTKKDIISERCGVRPLAIKGKGGKADWVQLSRKHAIDTNSETKYMSIFGGKLTDCINVGNEVAKIVKGFGINMPYANKKWYGEPDDSIKKEFLHRAELMDFDALTPESSSEPLTQRFWRRYGRNAINMLESIRENPKKGELLIKNSEYLTVELEHAANREMVTKLDDFLRRRSKISLVLSQQEILSSPGLLEACHILFGDEAEAKLNEYIRDQETN
ncbi:glycerol-3-phosphate dehydrogenase/oxidase [Aliiglaciecola sp. 3_MG-2023]|uniref:glycerol-3-phosphate dehydrogenase/oxidase n=1 Tax=Aliiglaciecola sp. 3_MG-2023 TaxID=3062644 RepID=UPI0026E4842D|nr:glycerol-3-phosphate dehydrogenase/oxidase [Aliiglaciecola sp. 3_MG-2023]MDO6692809.1 glycerol-3-phosphate dehydrogenase/oxidase [Aliiglaciecola sp. 3_MG-2023]